MIHRRRLLLGEPLAAVKTSILLHLDDPQPLNRQDLSICRQAPGASPRTAYPASYPSLFRFAPPRRSRPLDFLAVFRLAISLACFQHTVSSNTALVNSLARRRLFSMCFAIGSRRRLFPRKVF